MEILRRHQAPRYEREEGIVSYLLVSPRTSSAQHITSSLVEIRPGGEQRIHSHDPEQIYYILKGAGLMTVGQETAELREGDCVLIPSGSSHGIRNHTKEILRYFSAAAPSFDREQLRRLWPLASEPDEDKGAG